MRFLRQRILWFYGRIGATRAARAEPLRKDRALLGTACRAPTGGVQGTMRGRTHPLIHPQSHKIDRIH